MLGGVGSVQKHEVAAFFRSTRSRHFWSKLRYRMVWGKVGGGGVGEVVDVGSRLGVKDSEYE